MTRTPLLRGLAVLVALLVGVWVARNTYFEDSTADLPLKGEAESQPYYALKRLLRSAGVGFEEVSSLQAPGRHAVLITNGYDRDRQGHDVDGLEAWVKGGGHLVVSTADVWRPSFEKWSGIGPDRDKHPAKLAKVEAKAPPAGNKPLVRTGRLTRFDPDACVPVAMTRDKTTESLSLCGGLGVALKSRESAQWSLATEAGTVALSAPVGRGTVTVLPMTRLLLTRSLIKGDNARILLNALWFSHGDLLYLYGMSDAEKLFHILWRLVAPGLVLLGLALALLILRQLPRFGTPIPPPMPLRRSLAEQIRATAMLAWRTRRLHALRRAVMRALEETAGRQIASYRLLDSRRRAEVLARATGMDAAVLRSAMNEDATAAADVQRQAIATLQITRRRFVQRSSTQGLP